MSSFAENLKAWRRARRFSQLQLAHEAGVSTRHLAFLETARSNPSRAMVHRLGDALDLPLAERNRLLTLAGFAAPYEGRAWDDPSMAPVRTAVETMLANHEPFPALAVDRLWSIVFMNAAAARFFAPIGLETGRSMVETLLRPDVQGMIENWPQVARYASLRLRTESAAQGGVKALDAAAQALHGDAQPHFETSEPAASTVYNAFGERLSLFSTIAQFGAAEDLTLDDLKIELFFPADQPTERFFIAASEE